MSVAQLPPTTSSSVSARMAAALKGVGAGGAAGGANLPAGRGNRAGSRILSTCRWLFRCTCQIRLVFIADLVKTNIDDIGCQFRTRRRREAQAAFDVEEPCLGLAPGNRHADPLKFGHNRRWLGSLLYDDGDFDAGWLTPEIEPEMS